MRRPAGGRLWRTHHQASMLHALSADQEISQMLHVFGLPAQQNNFEAAISIQMGVEGRNDYAMMRVLKVGKLLWQEGVW